MPIHYVQFEHVREEVVRGLLYNQLRPPFIIDIIEVQEKNRYIAIQEILEIWLENYKGCAMVLLNKQHSIIDTGSLSIAEVAEDLLENELSLPS